MIIVRMQQNVSLHEAQQMERDLYQQGITAQGVHLGHERLLVVAGDSPALLEQLQNIEGVAEARNITKPYPLVSREWRPQGSVIRVGNVSIGTGGPVVIAGPCSVESEVQMRASAESVKRSGAQLLRGGAYKPRTNPYSFQGLGVEGLKLLKAAGDAVGLPVVTEVMTPAAVEVVSTYADMLQVGTRNMANFDLLRAVGQSERPVLLKRGMASTVDEWLQAAEYIVASGNPNVVLCERGIRSFDPATRNTLDLAGAVLAKQKTHLPVMVDPSHGTGVVSLIGPMSLAAIATGIDGVCLEMHPNPAEAFSDGDQALTPKQLDQIVGDVKRLATRIAHVEEWAEASPNMR